jgi:hypothetical protein
MLVAEKKGEGGGGRGVIQLFKLKHFNKLLFLIFKNVIYIYIYML